MRHRHQSGCTEKCATGGARRIGSWTSVSVIMKLANSGKILLSELNIPTPSYEQEGVAF